MPSRIWICLPNPSTPLYPKKKAIKQMTASLSWFFALILSQAYKHRTKSAGHNSSWSLWNDPLFHTLKNIHHFITFLIKWVTCKVFACRQMERSYRKLKASALDTRKHSLISTNSLQWNYCPDTAYGPHLSLVFILENYHRMLNFMSARTAVSKKDLETMPTSSLVSF